MIGPDIMIISMLHINQALEFGTYHEAAIQIWAIGKCDSNLLIFLQWR
jgi:hypothetical protein